MSTTVINHVPGMNLCAGKTLSKFGKDQTDKITYTFNQQGFRSLIDFNYIPTYAFFGCSLVFGIGVQMEQTFPYMFENSQNYGIAGVYNNHDTFKLINNFINSELYSEKTKIAVVWHVRDPHNLDSYYQHLQKYKILHFFCGKRLKHERCYSVFPNLDYDISNTHYGPKSHLAFYKLLCALFNL